MIKNISKTKTLLLYQFYRKDIDQFYLSYISRLKQAGFNVEGFCITLDPPGPRLTFWDLDILWKKRNKKLMKLYDQLLAKAKDYELILLYNGANLHPEFLNELKTFNAYMCFDDPESSENLSKPVAKYFDACFVGNIAAIQQYENWGCENIFFRPLGFFKTNLYDKKLDKEKIRGRQNNIDVCLFCERASNRRKERIEYIEIELPQLYGRGTDWPLGWVEDSEVLEIYSRSKIGLNIHNSTGPINLRTYALPANGVMQICDNKYFLGHLFELGKEAVGYNHIEEVPELVKFYLNHETVRLKISVAGFERAHKEYNEIAVWKKQMEEITKLL